MRFSSLEDTIRPDNQVRFIDAFVELSDISKVNLAIKTLKTEGRTSFSSKLFIRLSQRNQKWSSSRKGMFQKH